MDFFTVLNKWQDENKAWRNEGTTGVDNLENLCRDIGYDKNGAYINASPILNFLSDNSGAIEAIHEWMCKQDVDEWIESLENTLPEDEDEEDEDEPTA